ncbi:MAG: V-type sodium ATPase subunit D [Eubacteriales bacterium SKADARSKE-1]|nr:V-type sodium ATPase subunit D [Eubacteriales bacterium SKADARSKE-1]
MSTSIVPTKGNLIALKKSSELAKVGFELMDKKRNILIREMMALIKHANEIQDKIDIIYTNAYKALQMANVTLGICHELSETVPVDESLSLSYRSVMGVEIPLVFIEEPKQADLPFGLYNTDSTLDEAYRKFIEVKKLTAGLAEIENSIYRLADAICKAQKRANALKNIVIPRFLENIKYVSDALEEKDREDFSRLKVIKSRKG